ncbi:oligopeptide ABC transporter permease protein AppC [Oscillibacter sp. CAG:241]|nr:oligopeptide ABC transporter permease protein AppC [Oscillibacter sp. CAG:241]
MADRKDNINEQQAEQQAEQKLREEIREEMKNADQTPAEEHYSLNDDRRVKVLSPGMLVAKRFIRNRMAVTGLVILIFMFVFSFIGGLVSPYGQDQFFYTDKTIRKSFGEAKENTEFRYGSNSDELFGLTAQAKAMLAIQQGKDTFNFSNHNYTMNKVSDEMFTISCDGVMVGYAAKDMVNADAADQKLSFEFNYQALTAYATGAKEFTADGVTYALAEDGGVTLDGADYAYISRYLVQAISPDVFLSRDFKDKLLATIATAQDGKATFTYTDESLIMNEPEQTENGENADGQTSGINTEDPNAPKPDDTSNTATAEYDLEFKAATNSWQILQEKSSRQYDQYSFPNMKHWLGTDMYGMDMLTRLMYGGRVSLLIGFIVIIIETVIGVIFGGISGYFGGWVDNLIMRIVDIFYCIPSMPVIIILGAAMDASRVDPTIRMVYLMLILGFLGWAGIARLVRGQILSLREQEYMAAAEACGLSVSRRIFKHLIPNVVPQLIVTCTMGLGSVIIMEATLSFLGLGVKFPFASWGNIISDVNNTHVLTTYWFIWIPAGVLLLLTVLAFNLVGDGLRDAFDPKMKR